MIRLATEEDFPAILELCRGFWSHTRYNEEFDDEQCLIMIEYTHSQGLCIVLEVDGEVCGFMAAIKSLLLASTQAEQATEMGFWINPEQRKGRNGVVLIRFMEQLAKEQGIKYLNLVAMESSMPEDIKRLYEGLGYEKSETVYTKVI